MAANGWGTTEVSAAPVNPYAPPASDDLAPEARGGQHSLASLYVVSLPKFCVLTVATSGLYGMYWFYKQLRAMRPEWTRLNAVAGALFSLFFVHGLFRRIDLVALEAGLPGPRRAIKLAWPYIGLSLAAAGIAIAGGTLASVVSTVVALSANVPLARVQRLVNRMAGDERGQRNSRFTAATYVAIGLGIGFWVLPYVGLLPPAPRH